MEKIINTDERYNLVFRKGFVKNRTKENHVHPMTLSNYSFFCQRIIAENKDADLDGLYIAATFALARLTRDPFSDIFLAKLE